jgi:CheY-like chemotaxis protein
MSEVKSDQKPGRKSILIVDDEADIRDILQKRLFKSGFDADFATNGKHAVQKIASRKKYDLILSDFKMPLVDGAEFISALRKAKFTAPIILMTGQVNDRDHVILTFSKLGVSSIVFKPFTHDVLLTKINELLGLPATVAA